MSATKTQVVQALKDDEGKLLVALAEQRAITLAKRVKASQLRKLFYEVRAIEAEWAQSEGKQDKNLVAAVRRLVMFKPKLAYQVSRQKDLKLLQEVIDPAIDYVVDNPDKFPRFVELFEAILAYFYAHGGRD